MSPSILKDSSKTPLYSIDKNVADWKSQNCHKFVETMVVHISQLKSRRSIPVRTQTGPGRPDQYWEQLDNNNLIHTRSLGVSWATTIFSSHSRSYHPTSFYCRCIIIGVIITTLPVGNEESVFRRNKLTWHVKKMCCMANPLSLYTFNDFTKSD